MSESIDNIRLIMDQGSEVFGTLVDDKDRRLARISLSPTNEQDRLKVIKYFKVEKPTMLAWEDMWYRCYI